uniref:NADH-ubiquinone oxidoreductase chain 2 n=1 Tax=Staphylinoidea sp. 2 KM-2017 TaxID=2219456 RepID=A0A346RJP2_9COLE|nr:NADH dehydrogenase subunit 2 [Staphylinoidea sp. 2 KM-2017]
MFKFYKMLFLFSLIIGSLIAISSFSWMGMWLGLEINLLSIIPLMNKSKNMYSSEAAMKYFITQAMASTILLFCLILLSNYLISYISDPLVMILNSSLLLKMGSAPFHFWFPEVLEGLSWTNCFIMLTWQKLAPMVLLLYNMKFPLLIFIIVILGMLIGGISGLNQISLRKILAYSSINHMAWLLASMLYTETIWFLYFVIYIIISLNIIIIFLNMNIFFMKQSFSSLNKNIWFKLFFIVNFLSLGGLPPFLGFLPKWLTFYSLMMSESFVLITLMSLLTLITLFFYIRICFSLLVININEINYFKNSDKSNSLIWFTNMISVLGLIFSTLTFNYM